MTAIVIKRAARSAARRYARHGAAKYQYQISEKSVKAGGNKQ